MVDVPTTSRRAAAKKATQLAAEQLESTDEEQGGTGPSFGEPQGKKGQVKVTYAGKKRSPGKGRSNTISVPQPAKRLAALPLRSQSASPSPQKPKPRPVPVQRKRKPPTPKGKGKERLEPISLLSDSDDDVMILDTPPPSARRRLQHTQSSPTLRKSRPKSGPSKKRKYSHLAHDGGSGAEYDISSLSSLSDISDGGNRGEFGQAARAASVSRNTNSRSLNSPWRARAPEHVASAAQNDTIDLDEDIVLVFARLNISGALSDADDAIWWPAQVVDRGPPWRVSPFGKSPGCTGDGAPPAIDVPSPSPEVILPFCSAPRQLRFDEKTYSASARSFNLDDSPKKKRNPAETKIHTRWCQARDLMLKAYQDANDGVPLLLSRYIRDGHLKNGVFSVSANELSSESDIEVASSPAVPRARSAEFSMYDIPGELVLAKERPRDTVYWPAKLMKIVPGGRKKNTVYEVLFFDGTVKRLEDNKDMFFCSFHSGFKTCELGSAENDYYINEGDQDIDADNEHEEMADTAMSEDVLRCPSPPPELPAPTAFAHELSVPEQFAYVKPVLVALMNGDYEPAKWRHVDFMKGGKARHRVVNSAWQRGEVSHREKNALSDCIRLWMRRRLKRQELSVIPADAAVDVGATRPDPPSAPLKKAEDSLSERSSGAPLSRTHSYEHDTEAACSEADVPPSSFVTTAEAEAEDDEPCADLEPQGDSASLEVDMSIDANDSAVVLNGEMVERAPLNGELREDSQPLRTLPTYAMLSELDQITYCTSVLLPEAILQLLLWRGRHRTSLDLLSADEEKQLHELAEQKASETYWVHDIINLKRSIDRKTLPAHQSTAAAALPNTSMTSASGRSLRARRK